MFKTVFNSICDYFLSDDEVQEESDDTMSDEVDEDNNWSDMDVTPVSDLSSEVMTLQCD